MNKFLVLIFSFFCLTIQAQDTLANAKSKISRYSEKDIIVDNSAKTPFHFNPKFKDKYTSNDFQYEIKAPEKGIWDRFLDWLAYWFQKIFGFADRDTSTHFTSNLLNIIGIIVIVYVIYLISKAILNKEGQWIFGKSTTKKIIEHNDIERNLKNVDFEKLIKDTLNSGDKRLAIRYYYLWILKKMSEKNIIDWNPEKTNTDYLYEIQGQNLKKEFAYVSYLYNYIWYGEFILEEESFELAKKTFENTLKSIY